MTDPQVSIEVSVKLVGENYYEFSTPYGVPTSHGDDESAPASRIVIVEGTSSFIGPGLSVPIG